MEGVSKFMILKNSIVNLLHLANRLFPRKLARDLVSSSGELAPLCFIRHSTQPLSQGLDAKRYGQSSAAVNRRRNSARLTQQHRHTGSYCFRRDISEALIQGGEHDQVRRGQRFKLFLVE